MVEFISCIPDNNINKHINQASIINFCKTVPSITIYKIYQI